MEASKPKTLTPIIFYIELTYLGLEASKLDEANVILYYSFEVMIRQRIMMSFIMQTNRLPTCHRPHQFK